ncbi:hypothetical protein [Curtobacterium phage Parvaparticeps]|nr:hypothetical protein [Curtobacterium phage Parvaparticeps]
MEARAAIISKISERFGIDGTDAVTDAIRNWAEDSGREFPESQEDWINVEADAHAYASDYLRDIVTDHLEECDDCEGTKDVLAHIAEPVPNVAGSVFTQAMLDVDPNLGK